jgi:hypothetical protein
VTEILPKGVDGSGQYQGVWVASPASALSLAEALRYGLGQLTQQQLAAVGKDAKMEAVYGYITSTDFRHKIEAIIEAFSAMRSQIDQEKRAFKKLWTQRERQIEQVVENTAGLYGDLSGIAGASLPEIKALELGTLLEEDDSDTDTDQTKLLD